MRLVHKFSAGRKRKKNAEDDRHTRKRRQEDTYWRPGEPETIQSFRTPHPICSPVDDYEDIQCSSKGAQISFAKCVIVNTDPTSRRTIELSPSPELFRSPRYQNANGY